MEGECKCVKRSTEGGEFLELSRIVNFFKGKKGAAIPILQEVQRLYGYLPKEALDFLAAQAEIDLSQLYGVATFYSEFSLVPVGKNLIQVCQGTACHVAGAQKIMATIADELGIAEGETSKDLSFTLKGVSCLGACSLAPVMKIGEETFGRLTAKEARDVVRKIKSR